MHVHVWSMQSINLGIILGGVLGKLLSIFILPVGHITHSSIHRSKNAVASSAIVRKKKKDPIGGLKLRYFLRRDSSAFPDKVQFNTTSRPRHR